MNFAEILAYMKQGGKVKRPHWGGLWSCRKATRMVSPAINRQRMPEELRKASCSSVSLICRSIPCMVLIPCGCLPLQTCLQQIG